MSYCVRIYRCYCRIICGGRTPGQIIERGKSKFVLGIYTGRDANPLPPAGPPYVDRGLVFAGDRGQPLELRNLIRRHFKEILKAAGLPESLRLYDPRHSCATLRGSTQRS